jgi:rhomboid protease GluP
MDINHLLLWFVSLSCFSILLRAMRLPTDYNRGWAIAASLVLGLMAISIHFVPRQAGLIGGGAWAILFLIPIMGIRWVNALTYREHYQEASRLSVLLSWLHPADGWREYPAILGAIALGQQGQLDRANTILSQQQSPMTAIGRLAAIFRFRLESRWEDLLAWISEHQLRRFFSTDANLMLYYLRSLGETGDLNGLLQGIEDFSRTLERTGNTKIVNLARLFALAFCGETERLERFLKRSFSDYPQHMRQFWVATAAMAAGRQDEARQQFVALQNHRDAVLQKAIARRLQKPIAEASRVLTPGAYDILTRIEIDVQQEERYGKPFTFVSKRSYVTYGLIGLNALVFAVEVRQGGSENLETLYQLGALVPVDVWQGDWWRVITANFLHYGFLHLAMNMLGLFFLGGFVEATLGVIRYLITYFVSGIGAMSLISWLATFLGTQDQILVGASAAIMGLVGATGAIMLYGWKREHSRIAARNFRALLFVIGIQVIFDLTTPGVSFLGHTLGLIVGFSTSSILLMKWRLSL